MNADTLKNILAIPISAGEIRYKKKSGHRETMNCIIALWDAELSVLCNKMLQVG